MGYVIFFGVLIVVIVGGWLIRRYTRTYEDYHEREHQDPPVFDAGNMLGGGGPT